MAIDEAIDAPEAPQGQAAETTGDGPRATDDAAGLLPANSLPREASLLHQKVPPVAVLIAAAVLFLFVLPPLGKAGLWDPFELNFAELARRIAVNLHGAAQISLTGADNSLPHLNDLGRPQLPYTLVALGFKFFGLSATGGRALLAVVGVLGALATYNFVARLVDKRAGVFAGIALLTMPLYFVQARTMLGEITTLAALAFSFGGLAVAVFDTRSKASVRYIHLVLAALGLFAGYESRGVLIGLVIPLLSIGFAWGVVQSQASASERDSLAISVGSASLLAGAVLLTLGLRAEGRPGELSMWLGAIPHAATRFPTFDYVIGHIGHALAPWSAVVPFALGRLFVAPRGDSASAARGDSQLRVALLLGATVAVTLHGWIAPLTDFIPFSGVVFFAAACGIALRDLEKGAHPSLAVGLATAVFLALLHHDFHALPEKAFQAYGIPTATFPDGYKDASYQAWTIALVGMAALSIFVWLEALGGAGKARRTPFDPANYVSVFRSLRDDWDGNGAIAYYALVLGSSLAGLLVFVAGRYHWTWAGAMAPMVRVAILNAWWAAAIGPFAIVFGAMFAADVFVWAFEDAEPLSVRSVSRGVRLFDGVFERLMNGELPLAQDPERKALAGLVLPFLAIPIPAITYIALSSKLPSRPMALLFAVPAGILAFTALGLIGDLLRGSRAAFYVVGGFGAGVALSLGLFPGLANQLSPKDIFETYQHVHKGSEELALLGVSARTAAYYASGEPKKFTDAQRGFDWLTTADTDRRYLAARADDLARLNFLYRRQTSGTGVGNVPVLDGRRSQIVLTTSKLLSGEASQNPLDDIVLSKAPVPQHPLPVNLEDRLELIGFDIVDKANKKVEWVTAGRPYRMRTYYKVLASVPSEWEGFIHIDGYRRRHNGDHKVCNGKYPFSFWLPGDYIVDDVEFTLEQNFTAGEYNLWFGLYSGDNRMKVKSGASDGDNRINGGILKVR